MRSAPLYPMLRKILLVGLVLFLTSAGAVAAERPARLLVLTDVENEPDDSESLVRLMLYANTIDLEGLVATTSIHMQTGLAPESIHRVIDAYGRVLASLDMTQEGIIDHPLPQAREVTPYGRWGDGILLVILALMGGCLAVGRTRAGRS